jgi:putative ABC transport system permease protein
MIIMNSVLLIVKSNLTRRKVQNLSVGISIAIVSLLFSSSIGILGSIQEPFDLVFNNLNASHILLCYDYRSDNTRAITDWFARQPEVDRVGKATAYYMCNGPLFFKGAKLDVPIQITEYTADHLQQDKLQIMSGNAKDQPGYGEIWLPNYLASRHHIQIGDSIAIPASGGVFTFSVSATVSDPHYGSGMVNPTRAWIRAGTLPFLVPVSQLTNNCLGIRLKSPAMASEVLGRFNKNFDFSGDVLPYDLFKSAFMSIYQIIGGILFIFSFLALIISVFLINAAISKNIYDDYKLTGILKTLGFRPRNIISIYAMHYFLLAIVFIPLGFIGTYYILHLIIESLRRTVGAIGPGLYLAPVFSITFCLLLLTVLITSTAAGFKSGKIKPAEAIRYGAPGKNEHGSIFKGLIGRSSLPLLLLIGLRFTTENRRRMMVTFAVLLSTVFILSFSVNISSSLSALKNNKAAWGFENGDIQLSRNTGTLIEFTHQQLKEILQNERGIHSFMPFGYESLTVLDKDGNTGIHLLGKVYEGDINDVGLVNLKGRHPIHDNEIALCIGTSKLLNRLPGDTIVVYVEGQRIIYNVTGIYQDIGNMGQGFRLQESAIKRLNPLYTPNIYSLKLAANEAPEEYKNYLIKKYASNITIDTNIEDRLAQMGVISNMKITFLSLSLFFISILLLSIWNDVIISIRDYRKTFGILKTAGFTPAQLRKLLIWKMIFPTFISFIVGIPLALWLSPVLMSQVTKNLGLVHFPFLIDTGGTGLIAFLFCCGVILFTWASSSGASKVNPRILIIE